MEELTLEQKRAIAIANARLRATSAPARQAAPETYDPAEGMNALERGLVGAGASMRKNYLGLRSLIPGLGMTDAENDELATYERHKKGLGMAGTVGEFGTDVASYALPGGFAAKGVTKGLTMLPKAARFAAGLGANAGVDAGLSAAYATEDRGDAALMGAAGSVGGQLLGKGIGKVVGGLVRPSADAAALMQKGVQPTIGQAADQGFFAGRAIRKGEEIAQSVPLVGGIVSNARERAGKEAAQVAFDRAVAPGGVTKAVSREGVDELGKQFKQAYGVLDQHIFVPDKQIEQDVMSIVFDPNYRASRETIDGVMKFFNANYTKKFQQGPQGVGAFLSGDGFKALDSEIGRRIRDLAGQQGQEALAERRILTAIDGAVGQWRNRNLAPEVVDQLADTDRAYAAWKRIARASKYSADGDVTPAQLQRAVKAMSKGDEYGRGKAFMQDLTDPAAILRNRTPNSGTADRLAAMGLAGAAVTNPATFIPYAAGAAGLGGAYSRPGQKLLLGGYNRQKALEEALRRRNTYFGDVGAALVDE